jgi:hypothetical protein
MIDVRVGKQERLGSRENFRLNFPDFLSPVALVARDRFGVLAVNPAVLLKDTLGNARLAKLGMRQLQSVEHRRQFCTARLTRFCALLFDRRQPSWIEPFRVAPDVDIALRQRADDLFLVLGEHAGRKSRPPSANLLSIGCCDLRECWKLGESARLLRGICFRYRCGLLLLFFCNSDTFLKEKLCGSYSAALDDLLKKKRRISQIPMSAWI